MVSLFLSRYHMLALFRRYDATRYSHKISMNIVNISRSAQFSIFSILTVYFILINLFHTVTPNILPFDVDQALFSGESVQMMCHISKGDTPLEVYWEFNGKKISRELGTFSKVGDRSSVLMMPLVTGAHSGNYTCIAKNNAGTTSYTTILKIIGTSKNVVFTTEKFCLLFFHHSYFIFLLSGSTHYSVRD